MTKAQEVYGDTLNLLGCGLVESPELREALDKEHAAADPAFELILAERERQGTFVTA